ncbi:hypothetical protein WA026_011820 [Henosepilachna vigintioctopunctata]|uniref:Uncharacterized protein n=1 Tax=Henosepilachna vigintioctopunctata TaxID=420089 RepID=A0AAW1UKI5_9CUCU
MLMDKRHTNLGMNMTNSENAIMNTSSQITPSLTITDNSDNTLLHSLSLFSTSNSEPKSISSDFLQGGPRKSAFQPYKQVSCTPLTNLQRGNTQAEGASIIPTDINIHTLAGRGELTEDDLKNEKNIDVVDKDGYTPLHWAAAFGQYNAIQLILDHGADINKIGINEETALHHAANGGHHEVIRLLISHGAEVNRADHLLNTALMYAAKGNHPHSCNELLIGGADLGLSNMNDETAFTIAMKNNCNLAQSVLQKHILMKFET